MFVNFQVLLLIKSVNRLRENRMTPTYNSDRNREGWSTCESWGLSQSKSDTRMERTLCPRAKNWKHCRTGEEEVGIPTSKCAHHKLHYSAPQVTNSCFGNLTHPKMLWVFWLFFSFDSRVEVSCTSRHQSLLGRGVTISSFFQLLRTCSFFVTKASNISYQHLIL